MNMDLMRPPPPPPALGWCVNVHRLFDPFPITVAPIRHTDRAQINIILLVGESL